MTNHLEQRTAAELRAELARQGRSRHWLAEQTGKPVTTVARWLRGPQSPGLNDLDAMCRALGMSVADLLSAVERNGGYDVAQIPGVSLRSVSHYGSEGWGFESLRAHPVRSPHKRRRGDHRRQRSVVPLYLVRDTAVPA